MPEEAGKSIQQLKAESCDELVVPYPRLDQVNSLIVDAAKGTPKSKEDSKP
jgi:hypothetical protein